MCSHGVSKEGPRSSQVGEMERSTGGDTVRSSAPSEAATSCVSHSSSRCTPNVLRAAMERGVSGEYDGVLE